MDDDHWLEIEDDFNAASQHFAMAVQLFRRGGFSVEGIDGYAARMALMHSMQAGHTSLENGLKRILVILGEDMPIGERWQSDLIKRVSRNTQKHPAILSKGTSDFADETRRFRNVAVRNYDSFMPQHADASVSAAENWSSRLLPELMAFKAIIDH
jgi:hypothetical protein